MRNNKIPDLGLKFIEIIHTFYNLFDIYTK